MTAVLWEGAWRFSIFLAFLLMRHSTALHGQYTPYRSSDDRYDFVDVAQQQGVSNPSDTTRFFTADEVDEEFWLKQLGDDYKNAIHMQVGGDDHQNGVFNMSENGSAYKVLTEPIYSHSPIIDREIKMIPAQNSIHDQDKEIGGGGGGGGKQKKRNKNGDKGEGKKRQRKLKHERKIERVEKVSENVTEKQKLTEVPDDIAEPRIPALDQTLSDIEHTDLKRYTKFQHINVKYAPEQQTNTEPEQQQQQQQQQQQTVEEQMSQNKTMKDGQTEKQTPVVINLPETNKAIELETNDAPVVVKMPPVIYHSEPANMTDQHRTQQTSYKQQTETSAQTNGEERQVENNDNDDNDNERTKNDIDTKKETVQQTQQETEQQTEQQTQLQTHQRTEQQTQQQTYTPMTYEQQQLQMHHQQHFQQHTQYNTESQPYSQSLQYTNFPQQQQQQQHQITQYTQYPVQIPATQYHQTTLYNQPRLQQPHQQQYSPSYAAASTNYHSSVPLPYYNQGVYPSNTISSQPSVYHPNLPHLPNVEETRNTKVHYMLSKPSILTEDSAPYDGYDAAVQSVASQAAAAAASTHPEYTQGNPTNRELYQEGL